MANDDKTEKPTPKKKREARKKGQIARTQEIGQWLSLLVVSMAVGPLLSHEFGAWRDLMVSCFQATANPSPQLAGQLLYGGLRHILVATLIFAVIILFVSVAASLPQGGFVVATKAIKPDFSRLNLIKGFKNLLSIKTLWNGAKMLLKSLAVGLLVFMTIRQVMPLVGGLTPMDTVLDVVKSHALSLIRNVCVVALILAFADFAVTRKRVTKQLKMTKQEVKDENRNAEGDPLVKGAIRARQLAAARSRMIADVATADVVLVNPTHIAIALQYEPHKGAPRVIARGAGAIATQIRERAAEARIPTVQDIPLARALYVSTEVGQEIPRELFAAVAQILAFVINRKRNGVYGGEHTSPRAGASVPAVNSAARRRRVEARDLATQRREENKRTDTRPAGPPVG